MPTNIRDLMEHADDADDEDSDLTIDGKNWREVRRAQKAFNPNTFSSGLREWMATERRLKDNAREAAAADARRKAADSATLRDARQASQEARDLAMLHQQELARLRRESNAAALKYFLLGVAVTALSVFIGWLLSH
jgi:hypothetical protein